MRSRIKIHDYITPIREILRDKSADKKRELRRRIYKSRKILNLHLYKSLSVDQAVEHLLEPERVRKVGRFDLAEWEKIADRVWRRAQKILGRVPRPEIILYPGFGRCNGRVYAVDREPYLVCSPDFPGTTGRNLNILIAHEYGHFLRWKVAGEACDKVPIYTFIYEEGWATWLSRQILPEYPLNMLFMSNLHKKLGMPDPKGGYLRWCRRNLQMLAGEATKVLKSRHHKDRGRFFQCARFIDDDTPIRVGYYLGYRMIDMLGHAHTPRKLLCMKPRYRDVFGWLEKMIGK